MDGSPLSSSSESCEQTPFKATQRSHRPSETSNENEETNKSTTSVSSHIYDYAFSTPSPSEYLKRTTSTDRHIPVVDSKTSSTPANREGKSPGLSVDHEAVLISEQPKMTRPREIAFILITCAAQFLSLCALHQTVAPVMVLAKYFRIEDYGTLSWFSASFSMSVGTFMLPAGRLGDIFGHKRVYILGWLWFAIWSLITGFSYKYGIVMFSICRALQGIGPAFTVPNAVALIGRNIPLGQKRNMSFACFGAAGPTGAATGAFFASLIADLSHWPWNFWILAIVCIFTSILAIIILPGDDVDTPEGEYQRPEFDYWGTLTGVSGLVLVNFALNQAPLVGWATWYIATLLGSGVLLLITFAFLELYATNFPLVPIRGLHKDSIFALACIAVGWSSHGIWLYYLYLFLQHLRGQSALLASAETSPVAITGMLFAFSTVWLLRRVGVNYVMFAAMTFFALGAGLLATMPLYQTYWSQTFISILVMPGAMNLSYPAANILLSSALPKEKQGIAASLVSTLINYSISCGLGIAGTIDRYVIEQAASQRGWKPQDGNPAPLGEDNEHTRQIRLAGSRGAFYFATALGGAGMIIAFARILFTKKRNRSKVGEKASRDAPGEIITERL